MSAEKQTIRTYKNSLEAHLARTKLQNEGIDAAVHRFSRYRAASGAGFLLKVAETDAKRADALLGPAALEIDMDEYVDKDDPAHTHCPQCGSVNITANPRSRAATAGVILTLGLLSIVLKRERHCRKCGHDFTA